MKSREKLLAAGIGGLTLLVLGYAAVDRIVLAPGKRLEAQARTKAVELDRRRKELARLQSKASRLAGLAGRTLGSDSDRVSEKLRSRLVVLLERCGLDGPGIVLKPYSGRRARDAYREVGWSIATEGGPKQVVDFLYLLEAEPYLHRIEDLTLKPQSDGRFRLNVRYVSLVLDNPMGNALVFGQFPPAAEVGDLEGPERKSYDAIVARDLFRPYMKRPVEVALAPPPASPPQSVAASEPPQPQPQDDRRFRVVSLTNWSGQPEAAVRDTETGEIRRYKPGERLAGGKLLMIDYRRLPLPDRPEVLSPSRVLLKVGKEYCAIELGRSLSEKRRMQTSQLPPALRER